MCTPLGFVRLFGVVGQFLVKPQFLRNLNEEFFAYSLEEETTRRRLKHAIDTGKKLLILSKLQYWYVLYIFVIFYE